MNKLWTLLVCAFALGPLGSLGCDKKDDKEEKKDKKDKDDDDDKKSKKKKSKDDDDDDDKKKKSKDDDDDDKKKKSKDDDDDDKKKADDKGGDGKKLGIKACDEYLEKMEKCSKETKLGASTQKTLKESAESTRKAWATAADGPGKGSLETSCKSILESSAKSYKVVCPGVFDEK